MHPNAEQLSFFVRASTSFSLLVTTLHILLRITETINKYQGSTTLTSWRGKDAPVFLVILLIAAAEGSPLLQRAGAEREGRMELGSF